MIAGILDSATWETEYFCIDVHNKRLEPFEGVPLGYHKFIYREELNMIQAFRYEHSGLFDLQGGAVLPIKYDAILKSADGLVELWKNGQKSYWVIGLGLFD